MIALAEDINKEMEGMDKESARHFEHLVREMMLLLKSRGTPRRAPLAQRLKNHPAIGTWPSHLDPDAHIAAVRDEWDNRE